MKKVLFSFLVLFFPVMLFPVDIITLKNGDDISAKISEITQNEIVYKKSDNLEGPNFTVSKSDVLIVRYENGTKDIFNEAYAQTENKNTEIEKKMTDDEFAFKGVVDSKANYRGANSGAGWTAATTILFSPIIGIIPAIACASAPPSDGNLNYRDMELMKNSAYSNSYINQAHKTKKKRIWSSFGISSGIWGVLFVISNS